MPTSVETFSILLVTLGLSLGLVAQDSPPEFRRDAPPVAAITAEDNSPPADEAVPDTRPVTGVLPLTVGSFGTERSFLAPSFRFSQTLDTNPAVAAGQSDMVAVTNLAGSAQLQRVWRGRQFSLDYTVGGSIYAGHSDLNSMFQGGQIQQSFQFRRWSLTLVDDVSCTPESAFGYSGLSGGFNLTPGTAPNQSILTNHSQQISNTAVGQMNYSLNSRSSFTVAGNFGVLRYQGGDLLDSNQGGFQAGYNYNLNPRDSLGIIYGLNLIRYPGASTSQKLDSHNVQLAYGRKITGRLALRVSGGPQINQTSVPALASASVTQMGWTARSSLTYRFRKSEMELSSGHDVSAGAGVLGLAKSDQIQSALTSHLTRTISGSFRAGYAHNSSLQQVAGSPNPVFNTEFVSAGLGRPLGHEATMFFNYAFQHQSTNVLSCSLGLCGNDLNRHIVGMGFEWHMRPLLIH